MSELKEKWQEYYEVVNGDSDSVAAAILVLADEVGNVAGALKALGNGGAATDMGAIENLAMEIKEGMNSIALSIENTGDKIQGD